MTKMKDTCPNCGSHLVLKDGQFGEFLGCPRFPDCRYTRSLRKTEELLEPDKPDYSKFVKPLPEDWDFPCSDLFRAASFEYCGQPDPHSNTYDKGLSYFKMPKEKWRGIRYG